MLKLNLHYRGACTGALYSYSTADVGCPSNVNQTWKYWGGSSWTDAGEAVLVNCYNSSCSPDSPCSGGDGDCDEDLDCQGSLVCGSVNCVSGPAGLDCCTTSCHNDSDCYNQECNELNHCRLDSYSMDWSNCSQGSPCQNGAGDCDYDSECEGSLVCNSDSCANGPTGMDCCGQFVYKGNIS